LWAMDGMTWPEMSKARAEVLPRGKTPHADLSASDYQRRSQNRHCRNTKERRPPHRDVDRHRERIGFLTHRAAQCGAEPPAKPVGSSAELSCSFNPLSVSSKRRRPPYPAVYGLGHDVAQTEVPVSSPVHQQFQIIDPHPGVGVVLSLLQPRRSEIASNFHEIIEFAANNPVMLPFPVGDLDADMTQLPARLFLDFPCEGFFDGLACFNVATNNVPDTGQDSPRGRPALDEYATLVISNQRAHARWITHAESQLSVRSRENPVSFAQRIGLDNALDANSSVLNAYVLWHSLGKSTVRFLGRAR
jgi:hypothetical protein